MRRNSNILVNIDWITILIYIVLVLFGWINIYAAVYSEDHQSILDTSQRYGKQLIWIGASLFLIVGIFIINHKFYSFIPFPIYLLTIFLLIFVIVFGREVNGAKSWFEIGSFKFQPAEFAKFATSLVLAKILSVYNFKIYDIKNIISVGAIIFIPFVLILLQNDTGSALVYVSFVFVLFREGLSGNILLIGLLLTVLFILALFMNLLNLMLGIALISFIIFWFNSRNFKYLGVALGVFLLSGLGILGLSLLIDYEISEVLLILISLVLSSVFYVIWAFKNNFAKIYFIVGFAIMSVSFVLSVDYIFNNVLEEHHRNRINNLLGIEYDPLGTGYNVNQSKIAIGSGGFSGKGFLNGTQTKFNFVPEQSTDFIFCTVGEEWGFLGTSSVIILFAFLIIRLIFLAERQRSAFSRIYGYSVAGIIFFHVAINIGMTIGLAPVIGIPLPFFSYGGSSLWSFTILLFIFIKLDAHRMELL